MIHKIFKNNKGVTLIEMILVIAISVVLVGLAGLSLSLINSANSQKAANSLRTMFVKAKTESMGKGKDYGMITVTKVGIGVEAELGDGVNFSKHNKNTVASNALKVYFAKIEPGAGGAAVSPSESLSDFSLLTGSVSFNFNSAGMVSHCDGAATTGAEIYEFAFARGKRVDAVVIYAGTGNIEYRGWFE